MTYVDIVEFKLRDFLLIHLITGMAISARRGRDHMNEPQTVTLRTKSYAWPLAQRAPGSIALAWAHGSLVTRLRKLVGKMMPEQFRHPSYDEMFRHPKDKCWKYDDVWGAP